LEQGGAEGDGGGTTAYSTDGVVLYTPTQAETDQEAFILIAKKTGCIPVALSVVTSASASTGYAGVDWAKVTAPTTTLALTGTTIASTQKVDVETIKTNPVVNAGTVTFPTTATLASTTNITGGTITTATNVTTVNGLAANVITAAAINADAITAAKVAADVGAEIADAVWDEARAGHVTAGSYGEGVSSVQGNVTGSVGSVTGAVGSVTGAVGSVTGNVGGSVGSVTGAVGSVTGAVGSVTGNVGGNVTGSVGSLATQAKADVNAEVVDALATDTYAEPGQGAPAATATLAVKMGYLYKAWRNKTTQTATDYKLFADDTTTVDQKASVSDDTTTFTKGEVATGP
jgi:hypothetical protein